MASILWPAFSVICHKAVSLPRNLSYIVNSKLWTVDLGNIIYIAAVIIYFIYSAIKKGKENQELPSEGESQTPRRTVTFEDLLKEIRDGQRPQETYRPKTVEEIPAPPKREHKPVAETVFEEKKQVQKPKKAKAYEAYQGTFSDFELSRMKAMEQPMSNYIPLAGIKSDLAYEETEKERKANRYRDLLKNPTGIKDAVVLSEILNRRYFWILFKIFFGVFSSSKIMGWFQFFTLYRLMGFDFFRQLLS